MALALMLPMFHLNLTSSTCFHRKRNVVVTVFYTPPDDLLVITFPDASCAVYIMFSISDLHPITNIRFECTHNLHTYGVTCQEGRFTHISNLDIRVLCMYPYKC